MISVSAELNYNSILTPAINKKIAKTLFSIATGSLFVILAPIEVKKMENAATMKKAGKYT